METTKKSDQPWSAVLIVCALGYAVFAQGGFYKNQFITLVLLITAAFLVTVVQGKLKPSLSSKSLWFVAIAFIWTLISAEHNKRIHESLATFAFLSMLAMTWSVARNANKIAKQTICYAIVSVGVLSAGAALIGVTGHRIPWALADGGLWRGATTVTYANASAALLLVCFFVSLELARTRKQLVFEVTTALIFTAFLSTLSRAGFLSFGIAFVVYAVFTGIKTTIKTAIGPGIAGIVGYAVIVPTVPQASQPRFILLAASVAGIVLTVFVCRIAARYKKTSAISLALFVVVALVVSAPHLKTSVHKITSDRLSTQSPDRTNEWNATKKLIHDNQTFGVGPGPLHLHWIGRDGITFTVGYSHNEYLQAAAQFGYPGLLIALGSLIYLGYVLVKNRRNTVVGAAGLAVFAGLIVHSGFDFLWHIPLIPVLAFLTFGLTESNHAQSIT